MSESHPQNVDPNPYDSSPAGREPEESLDPRPRVWPLWVASLAELIFVVGLQAAAAAAVMFATMKEGQSIIEAAAELPAKMMDAPMFVATLVLSGGSMIAASFLFGWWSAKNRKMAITDRLGLRWPGVPFSLWISLLLGSVPVLLLAVGAVILVEQVIPATNPLCSSFAVPRLDW